MIRVVMLTARAGLTDQRLAAETVTALVFVGPVGLAAARPALELRLVFTSTRARPLPSTMNL